MDDRYENNQVKKNNRSEQAQGQPTRWYCDTDCRAANRPCRGESGKDPTAKNLCPYYEDMLF